MIREKEVTTLTSAILIGESWEPHSRGFLQQDIAASWEREKKNAIQVQRSLSLTVRIIKVVTSSRNIQLSIWIWPASFMHNVTAGSKLKTPYAVWSPWPCAMCCMTCRGFLIATEYYDHPVPIGHRLVSLSDVSCGTELGNSLQASLKWQLWPRSILSVCNNLIMRGIQA